MVSRPLGRRAAGATVTAAWGTIYDRLQHNAANQPSDDAEVAAMTSRPSTAAVLAAYQVLKPGDLVPPLVISDAHFEQLRAALAAAYRVDYHTIDQVRLLRAVYLYRGAMGLIGPVYHVDPHAARPRRSEQIQMLVQLAGDVLEAAEKYSRESYGQEEPHGGPQLPLG